MDCLPSEGVIIKQPECTCQVGGPEELDAGSVREEVRSELANVVLPGQRLRIVAHPALKQALKTVEKERQRITVQDITDFGVAMELDQKLQHFLVSRTEGEALETVRGAERQPGLEQCRRLAAMYDPLAAGRSVGDSRQSLSPTKVTKLEDLSHALQAWRNLEQRHQERTRDKLPKDMKPAILMAKESTAQQHLFLDFEQVRAHIVTVINTRTRGLLRWLWDIWNSKVGDRAAGSDEVMESEDRQLYRLEIKNRKRILTLSQGRGSHKGGGKEGKSDTECFLWFLVWARWPHQSWIAEPKPTSTEVT